MRYGVVLLGCSLIACGGGKKSEELLCDGTALTEWVDNDKADVDYTLDCLLEVEGSLSIAEGVVIEVAADAGITVTGSGKVTAVGSGDAPIVFQSANPGEPWVGLSFFSSETSTLDHVVVDEAGAAASYGSASVQVGDDTTAGNLSLSNTTISNGAGTGLVVANGTLSDFAGNTISGNAMTMAIHQDNLAMLAPDNTLDDNTFDAIEILGSASATGDVQTWPLMPEPYYIRQDAWWYDQQTIQPGVQVLLDDGANVYFVAGATGALIAEGTAAEPIIFIGKDYGQGTWNSIYLAGGGSLANCKIGGGSGADNGDGQYAQVVFDMNSGGAFRAVDCVFQDSGGYGLWLGLAVHNDVESDNLFSNNNYGDVGYGY